MNDDWKTFLIRRIKAFAGRTVGSLTDEEVRKLGPWLAEVKRRWTELDDEIRRTHNAVQSRLEDDAKRAELITPASQQREETRQSLRITISPAPLTSRSQIRKIGSEVMPPPAPIITRPVSASDEARQDDDSFPPGTAVERADQPSLSDSSPKDELPDVSEESESYKRLSPEAIITHFGIKAIHPATNALPLLNDEDFRQLYDDIRSNGFLHPIRVTDEGILIAGRCRLQAAWALSIEPPIERFNPVDVIGFVISEDIRRRHLSAGQKALIAEKLAKLPRGNPQFSDSENSATMTQKEVAKLVGTNPQAITQVRLIREWADEEVAALEAGTQNLKQAYERAEKKKRKAEGKLASKRKSRSKPTSQSAGSRTLLNVPKQSAPIGPENVTPSPAPEPITLEQRASALFAWMHEVHAKPLEYDGAAFADHARKDDEENFQAVADFYKALYKRFNQRFYGRTEDRPD
jgi:hypothetical protein